MTSVDTHTAGDDDPDGKHRAPPSWSTARRVSAWMVGALLLLALWQLVCAGPPGRVYMVRRPRLALPSPPAPGPTRAALMALPEVRVTWELGDKGNKSGGDTDRLWTVLCWHVRRQLYGRLRVICGPNQDNTTFFLLSWYRPDVWKPRSCIEQQGKQVCNFPAWENLVLLEGENWESKLSHRSLVIAAFKPRASWHPRVLWMPITFRTFYQYFRSYKPQDLLRGPDYPAAQVLQSKTRFAGGPLRSGRRLPAVFCSRVRATSIHCVVVHL